MNRFTRFLAVCALIFAGVAAGIPAAQAQRGPAAPGGVVTSIVVQGSSRVELETIRSYISLKEGQPFDPEAADRSLKALFATGLFSDVTFQRDGGTLIVKVVENPIINRIAFEGNKKLDDDQLKQEIQTKPRTVFTRAKVQADVKRLLEVYRRSGKFNASIEPKVIKLEQNRVDLVFEISEGDTTGIRRITFIGNERFKDGTLREKIRTTESAWYRLFTSDDRYDPDRINFDKELLRKFYLSEGYADFRVLSAVAELAPDREGFYVTFTISEGERYKFGKVDVTSRFEGLDVDAIKALVTAREGDWYNAERVEQTITAVSEAVGTLGYAFVDVRPNIKRNKETLTVDVTFDIQEGPRVYVERINISGNTRTLDKVIRREFRLSEGDAFNTAKLRRSQQRLQNLGFFEKVDISNQAGASPDRTVIEVNVVEQSTGEISFGAGFSTSSGPLADISVRERNLLGRGQDLRLSLSLGTKSTQVDLSFTEPFFLDRNVAAGFDVFRITRDNQKSSSYDEKSIGFALRAGWSLSENTRQSVKYTLHQDKISNVGENASAIIKQQAGTTVTSEFGTSIAWDTRDNRQAPTKGTLVRYSLDIAGAGGTEHYVRNKVDAACHYSVFDEVVFSLIGQAGVIVGLGGDNVSINSRFFLGGDNFRGFATGGVGPHDGGDALGGKYFYVASAEFSFPIGLPREIGILGKAFIDAGSLWAPEEKDATTQDSKSIRVTAGVGVQWVSPFGPIRVDYALPIRREKFDKVENFRFSFGTRF
ncbi:MAG: outer membrane protein assembly factor BamA [Rhodospirillales bacterium]|nr:MAG: outer membrane protein assembly factor BamA [Rhodospirillales bacterium]